MFWKSVCRHVCMYSELIHVQYIHAACTYNHLLTSEPCTMVLCKYHAKELSSSAVLTREQSLLFVQAPVLPLYIYTYMHACTSNARLQLSLFAGRGATGARSCFNPTVYFSHASKYMSNTVLPLRIWNKLFAKNKLHYFCTNGSNPTLMKTKIVQYWFSEIKCNNVNT